MLGFEQLGFVALIPNAVPVWPEAGPGVVLSRVYWQAPPEAARLVGMGLRAGKVDLAGLTRMPRDSGRRSALALAVLTGDCSALGQISDQEFDWLLAHEHTRTAAIAHASADQVVRAANLIDAATFDVLTPQQLAKFPPSVLAKMLQGRPDAVRRFVAVFGPGTEGVEGLLSAQAGALAQARHGPVTGAERIFDLTDDDLDQMDQAGVFQTMSLRWLAALRRLRPGRIDRHFDRRIRDLLPEGLVAHLLGSGADTGAVQVSGNPPEPHADWLAGISFERLVEAGPICMNDRAWRRWWVEAIRLHPDAQKPEIATLAAPWSRETAAWLVASARDGEISAEDVRGRIAAFVKARAPIAAQSLGELLAAGGVMQARELADIVQGRSPPHLAPDERFGADMKLLSDAGILTDDAVQEAMRGGLPAKALAGLISDTAAVALVDFHAPAPARPPASWHSLLEDELRRGMADASFWRRWPQGVGLPLLEWMREQLKGGPEEAIVDTLLAAAGRSRVLSYAELARVCGGIAPLDLVWQVIERIRQGGCDRGQVLHLLDDGRLRAELRAFLHSELGALAPVATPELTIPEMIAVRSLLDPGRDIVRQIMARPSVEPGEDILLAHAVTAIRRQGWTFALPAPSAEQAARRPAWVAALSELPGWNHWRGARTGMVQ